MARTTKKTVKVAETTAEKVIVFQLTEKVTDNAFELLSKMVKDEHEATGVKIVLAPASVKVEVGEDDEDQSKESPKADK